MRKMGTKNVRLQPSLQPLRPGSSLCCQAKQQIAVHHAMALEYRVGQRVSFKNHRCTVQYIGKVEGADPDKIWLGVEWDDPTRGKHNGEYLGQRYFKCMVL